MHFEILIYTGLFNVDWWFFLCNIKAINKKNNWCQFDKDKPLHIFCVQVLLVPRFFFLIRINQSILFTGCKQQICLNNIYCGCTYLCNVHVLNIGIPFEYRLGGILKEFMEREVSDDVFYCNLLTSLRLHLTQELLPTCYHLIQKEKDGQS